MIENLHQIEKKETHSIQIGQMHHGIQLGTLIDDFQLGQQFPFES